MNKTEENLFILKWIFVSVLVCAFVGVLVGVIKVIYFEQTTSGMYAIHNECTEWDEVCVQGCEQAGRDNPQNPPSCSECCTQHRNVVDPLGKRLKEVAKLYGVVAGSIGAGVGVVVAGSKRRKEVNN